MECIRAKPETLHIKLTVTNDLTHEMTTYKTFVKKGWVLFGALNNLQDSCKEFRFTYTIDKHYGLYLESVNGLYGSDHDHTYWQLLKKTARGRKPLDTGIGSYQPKKNEHIILRFTKWDTNACPTVPCTGGSSWGRLKLLSHLCQCKSAPL